MKSRGAEIYVSFDTIHRLRAAAELTGNPSYDALADQWLQERLKDYPLVDLLMERKRKAVEECKRIWLDELNKKEAEQSELP